MPKWLEAPTGYLANNQLCLKIILSLSPMRHLGTNWGPQDLKQLTYAT